MVERAVPAASLATGVALVVAVLWGASPLATKLAVIEIDPVAVAALRTVLSALVALPLVIAGRLRLPRATAARSYLAVSSLGGFVVFPLLFSVGTGRTSVGHAALILGTLPVLTGLIAALLERRIPGGQWWAGCALALAGTAALVGARVGLGDGGGATATGDLLVLAGAVAAAAGYVTGARAARELGSWTVTLWGIVIGSLVLLPLLPFVLSPTALGTAGPRAWGGVLYLAIITSIVGYAAWYWALGRGGIGRTGLTQFLQPLVGLVLAMVILGETLTWPMIVAAMAILGGVAWARRA
ncbi:MAG TPA: DMT family transporter [Kiloniellales bacterium]